MKFEAKHKTDLPASAIQQPARRPERFRRRHGLLLAVVAMAVGFWLGGYWLATAERNRDPSGLDIEPQSLDLGHIWAEPRHWSVLINNRSQITTRVESILGGCNCIHADPATFTLRPGEERAVDLSLDLSPRALRLQDMTQSFNSVLVARLDREPWYARWSLSGIIHTPIVVSPTSVALEQAEGDSCRPHSSVVRIELADRSVRLHATCDRDIAQVSLDMGRSPSTHALLHITPQRNLAAGTYDFPVTLHATMSKRQLPIELPSTTTVDVPVRLTVHHEVRPGDATIFFGTARQGDNLLGRATLVSSRRPFVVLGVNVAPDGTLEVQLPETTPARHQSLGLRVPKVLLGHHEYLCTFRVVHKGVAPEEKFYDVTCKVIYDGVAQ